MAQSVVWLREDVKRLIEMLEGSPELWDSSNKMYKDRTKKNSTIEKFAEHFKVTTVEINRKLHNLRTQMNNEIRKIKKRKSGDGPDDVTFTSNWEFFDALKFMIGGMTCERTQSTLESTRETNPDNESQGTEKSAGGSEDEFSVTQNNRTINIPVKSQCASKKSGGKTKNISKEDELLQMAIGEMKRNDDEQIFGDFVASSLRNLHSDIAKRQLKRKIQISIIEMTDYDEELFQGQPSVGQPNTSSQYNISTESSTECFEFDV